MRSGAGKTMTIRVLTTLTRPSGGRATVAGHDVVTEAMAVRRSIGVTVAVIDHGRVIAEGTARDLKARVGGARLEVSLGPAGARRR